jgi:hypothetical protein
MSLIHGVFEIWISSGSAGFPATPAGGAFTWVTVALLTVSAVFALAGGVLAFNRRRAGGIFFVVAALICFFAHPYTRYYGGIYFVGGILTFFLQRPSDYEDDDEDEDYEDEDDYDGEDENEDDYGEEDDFPDDRVRERDKPSRFYSYGKRRERSAALKENKAGYGLDRDSLDRDRLGSDRDRDAFSKLNEPVRTRSSKVCPACGASVGIDHKFCYTCGGPLYTASPATEPAPDAAPYDPLSSPMIVSVGDDGQEEPSQESASLFKDFKTVHPSERLAKGEEEEDDEGDGLPSSSPHRVFVKPAEDSGPIPKRPLRIKPDDSYENFGHYLDRGRRTRRRYSRLRRIVGPLVLLLAIGGSAWFLLGRKVSEKDLPVPPPIPPTVEPIEPAVPFPDPVAPEGPPMIRIDAPARGVVVGSNVNVRPDHSISGTAITRLNADARVELIDQWEGVSGNLSGPWFRIRTGGREGWIYGQYLQPLDARPATLPEGYTASLLKTFGSSKIELSNQLGQPSRQTATTLTWPGLTANFRGENEITRLQINSAKHVLLNGVAVGITDEQLYKNVGYPSDYRSGQLRYIESGSQGMSVRMQNGKVQSITVGNI